MGGERDPARVPDLLRVGVDRRRLLADRELDAGAVVDRAAAGGDLLDLLVLGVRERGEVAGVDALEPERAHEHGREGEPEDREEQANPPVGLLVTHGGGQPPR